MRGAACARRRNAASRDHDGRRRDEDAASRTDQKEVVCRRLTGRASSSRAGSARPSGSRACRGTSRRSAAPSRGRRTGPSTPREHNGERASERTTRARYAVRRRATNRSTRTRAQVARRPRARALDAGRADSLGGLSLGGVWSREAGGSGEQDARQDLERSREQEREGGREPRGHLEGGGRCEPLWTRVSLSLSRSLAQEGGRCEMRATSRAPPDGRRQTSSE